MNVRNRRAVLILAVLVSACQPAGKPAPKSELESRPAPASEVEDPLLQPWDAFDIFLPGLSVDEPARNDPLTTATVYHLDLVLAEDLLSLSGRQEARFFNPLDKPLETIYLRLFANLSGGNLTIGEIQAGGQPCERSLQAGGSVLAVTLPEPLMPGEEIVLQLTFDLQLPQTMEGNYGLFGYHDEILLLQEFHPMIPALTQAGWALEVPPPYGDLTHQEAGYYLVRLQLPADLTLISSGVLIRRMVQDSDQIVLLADGPARDMYIAASRNFTAVTGSVGDTSLLSYAGSENLGAAAQVNEIMANAMTVFEELLSPYPYAELEAFATPMQAVGMEYPGVIALSDRMYDPQATIAGIPGPEYMEGTVVHEVAHQWFYNLVGNDQVEAPWLDEALVQYVTALYFRARYGQQGYDQFRSSWLARWDRVERQPMPIGLPTGKYSGAEYSSIVYGRGPLFMEELAETMGDDAFARFLKSYVDRLHWGISTPAEFARLAEETCRCDLDPLLENWVFPD